MKLMNDTNDPQLLGIVEDVSDYTNTLQMVDNLNKDLIDSGFDQYQYKAIKRGKKVYIERVGA